MSQSDQKKDRRVVRSQEALRQSLLQMMSQKDFGAVSITEIVELANYNRGTFYSHYENKEALLDDIMNGLIADLLKSFRAPYENQDVFQVQELTANSVKLFEHVYENASVYTTLLRSNVMPILREKMYAALKEISMNELVYPDSGIDPELHATFSIHGLLGLIFHWVETGFAYSPAYMQEQLVKMIHWKPIEAKTVRRK